MNKLLKFEKAGCNPCFMMQNLLDSKEIEAVKVDVFDNPELAGRFDIGSVPTLVLVDGNNNEIGRSIGYKPDEIESLISQL